MTAIVTNRGRRELARMAATAATMRKDAIAGVTTAAVVIPLGPDRALRVGRAAEADVAHAGVDHLWAPGRGPVAPARAVGAQERPAFDDPARHGELRLAWIPARLFGPAVPVG